MKSGMYMLGYKLTMMVGKAKLIETDHPEHHCPTSRKSRREYYVLSAKTAVQRAEQMSKK